MAGYEALAMNDPIANLKPHEVTYLPTCWKSNSQHFFNKEKGYSFSSHCLFLKSIIIQLFACL